MRSILFVIVAMLLSACSTTSPDIAMQQDVDQATSIIQRFQEIPEKGIPPSVLKAACPRPGCGPSVILRLWWNGSCHARR